MQIIELPIGTWTDDYVPLETLIDQPNSYVKDYTDMSTDNMDLGLKLNWLGIQKFEQNTVDSGANGLEKY